jgi:hypothetical protein
MRTTVQISPRTGTWLHSRNELSSRYVKDTFNLNQGPDNEAVLNDTDGIKNTDLAGLNNNIVTPDPARSPIIHYHMIFFHDIKYSQ